MKPRKNLNGVDRMDMTPKLYQMKMDEISKYYLQGINCALMEFINIFPHNVMSIRKQKADIAAYNASSFVWDFYPAVRESCSDIENTLYLASNEVFLPSLYIEVAKLQLALEGLLEAFKTTKGNPHMQEFLEKNSPLILQKPKDLVKYLVSDLIQMEFLVLPDIKIIYETYREVYLQTKKGEEDGSI